MRSRVSVCTKRHVNDSKDASLKSQKGNGNTYIDPEGTFILRPFRTHVLVENFLNAFKTHMVNSDLTRTMSVAISLIVDS